MDTLTAHSQHEEVSMTDRLSVGVCAHARVHFPPDDNNSIL